MFSIERLTAPFRARLISGGVAFAVPGNQLFVPELATDLREHFRAPKRGRPDKLSPSAQVVLFFHLLKGEREQVWTPTGLTEALQYSIMTMSRALDELANVGLAWIERRGRMKRLSFRAEGQSLIDVAKTLLIRPERRLDHVHWVNEPPELPLAGEHALARLTDLSPPSTPPVYAVTPAQMRDLLAAGLVDLTKANYDSDGTLGIGVTIRGCWPKAMWSIRSPSLRSSGITPTSAFLWPSTNWWSDGHGERTRPFP